MKKRIAISAPQVSLAAELTKNVAVYFHSSSKQKLAEMHKYLATEEAIALYWFKIGLGWEKR